jgi:formate dehydrogenase iron-sulfur subunit
MPSSPACSKPFGDHGGEPLTACDPDREVALSAVAIFSRVHETAKLSPKTRYRDLVPFALPRAGEQFGFEVDLDACSGCKACVTACHSLNGLEDDETWRRVGLLIGRGEESPVTQHVTTACHHCVDPACLRGCPVGAYEKDPLTGIVRHLDDQCFGCRYCELMCPYDVPQFRSDLGIVRKCDMCRDRLLEGESPACVAACPNEAIAIRVVSIDEVREWADRGVFLPDSPDPRITTPTTLYRSSRDLESNCESADRCVAEPAEAHPSLVGLLVGHQISVGLLGASLSVGGLSALYLASAALTAQFLASICALTHLGRPWLFFRAFIGWRTSWLSRETIAFGAYAGLLTLHTIALRIEGTPSTVRTLSGAVALAGGLIGLVASAKVYAATQRPFWSLPRTSIRFAMTSLAWFAIATVLLTMQRTLAAGDGGGYSIVAVIAPSIFAISIIVKLAVEGELVVAEPRSSSSRELLGSRLLLTGTLRSMFAARGSFALLAIVVLSSVVVVFALAPALSSSVGSMLALGLAAAALLAGDILERHLFFRAVVAPRMPGGLPC